MTSKQQAARVDDIQTLFNQALQFQNAGNLPEAEKIYRRILAADPHHAYSLNMLGLVALDTKHYGPAEDLVRKAIAERPNAALFHDTLGNILKAQNKTEEAIACFEKALELKPDFIDSLNNLGGTLLVLGRSEEALPLFMRAIFFSPGHFNSLNNIGAALQHLGRHEESIHYYRQATEARPDVADVHYNIGQAYRGMNRPEEAKQAYRKTIELQPDHGDAHLNLGFILGEEGLRDEALECFYNVTKIRPSLNACANIAHLLFKKGMLQGSIDYYRKALELSPSSPEILNNMGSVYNLMTEYEEAMKCFEQALAIKPGDADTLNNQGTALKNMGRLGEAAEIYKKAVSAGPGRADIHSNYLLMMIYSADVTPEELVTEAKKFGEMTAPYLRNRELVRDLKPERRLRIGYVSADFRAHAVHYFFEPLLNLRDPGQFEIFVYSNTEIEDEVTERIKKKCDHWHDIRVLNNDAVADLIEKDRIDILMDISGHTGGNRLMVFARKPAPIQVTWLAYPATTGMQAMDYRVTDSYVEPPGMTEQYNVEKLWRLPEIFCCYQPHENSPPVTGYPLFEDNGYITFGCFNNFAKVTDPVLETWGKIMAQVPDSRLMLEIPGINLPAFRANVEERLKRHGIPLERTVLERRIKSNQFVLYNEIDIALDPFPCVGGTTSMDTLWMGVPFVTLAGKHFGARMGVTILTNAGLQELIAENREEYIKIAVDLATNRARLKTLRHDLREKIATSPLMNQQSFTRNMENAYREMWRIYCSRWLKV